MLGVRVRPHGHRLTLAMLNPAPTGTSTYVRRAMCRGSDPTATRCSASTPSIQRPVTRSSRTLCTESTKSSGSSPFRSHMSRTSVSPMCASEARRTLGTLNMRNRASSCTTKWLWWSRCTTDPRLTVVPDRSRRRIMRGTTLGHRDLQIDTDRSRDTNVCTGRQ